MHRDGVEVAKGRMKFKCPKISHKNGCISCTCETPCSDAKYGRTVHLVMKDNPRLFNNPPWSSKEWKLEYNARTSAERSNKREKLGFKLEDGRHRSTKMWYCRLYHILMLQHLDAWDLPPESTLKKMIFTFKNNIYLSKFNARVLLAGSLKIPRDHCDVHIMYPILNLCKYCNVFIRIHLLN